MEYEESEAEKERRKKLAQEAILKQSLPPREKLRQLKELQDKSK